MTYEVYRSKRDEYERHHSLIDFFSTLDIRFYNECLPQPGCSSRYGEYGMNYYTYFTNYIWRNLVEIADRVGIEDDYTEEQVDAALDLVIGTLPTPTEILMKGRFVDE